MRSCTVRHRDDAVHLSRRVFLTAMFAIAALYVGYQFLVNRLEGVVPYTEGDASLYLHMASQPIFSSELLQGLRPPTAPIVFKLCGGDPIRIVRLQAIVSTLSWLTLAIVVAATMRSRSGRLLAFASILLFSLALHVTRWNPVVLSESISCSLLALWIAALLRLLTTGSRTALFACLATGAAWGMARETNAYVIAGVGGVAIAVAFAGLAARVMRAAGGTATWIDTRNVVRAVVLGVVYLIVFVVNGVGSETGRRWLFPYYNVVAQRILTNGDHVQWFVRNGMPMSPTLSGLTGQWASSEGGAFYTDPALEPFRDWVLEAGKLTYARFLLENPRHFILGPWSANGSLFFPNDPTRAAGARVALPKAIDGFIYPGSATALIWFALLGSVGLVASIAAGRTSIAVAVAVLALASIPMAWLVWHADAMEIDRHSLPVALQLRLSLLILILLGVDALTSRLERRLTATPH